MPLCRSYECARNGSLPKRHTSLEICAVLNDGWGPKRKFSSIWETKVGLDIALWQLLVVWRRALNRDYNIYWGYIRVILG